ncbi:MULTISPECIES: L,D-transpeptidase family protein [unclassified Paracoccus (in: a-proteobacteria)]|uniref:L,D-transpeptidase family protein n=1 Tax=unclassified Paracoccus (in: a-proteobacteria) TaxID=2688777 RepID=UPI0012B3C52C|nr:MULTISPECIES: L,D-transpeptidase family protein [unclassified Paracoccus (in: a-proteobacteria)]UXU76039.1 L,D-transpeptidase family protein [Paracoccus sp. SMMA_5]UXU81949.1 L,D-transpeptidase family protein [Paracoccus sp. SMMA_5_TC]
MIRAIRALIAVVAIALVASCGGDSSKPSSSKFKTYHGPPVTQVVVKKGERRMYLLSGRQVLKSYDIGLGTDPNGPKRFEGDGRTPEGMYFIDRKNPASRYHLSVGISYPSAQDVAQAAMMGLRPGGDIMIHGLGPEGRKLVQQRRDWTAGCIAVTDEEMEEIFAMLQPGVPIFIYP